MQIPIIDGDIGKQQKKKSLLLRYQKWAFPSRKGSGNGGAGVSIQNFQDSDLLLHSIMVSSSVRTVK